MSTSTLGSVGCDCKHDKCHLKTLFLFPKPHALDPEPQAVNPRGSLRKRLDDGFGSWQRQHLSSPQDFGIWENQGFGFQALIAVILYAWGDHMRDLPQPLASLAFGFGLVAQSMGLGCKWQGIDFDPRCCLDLLKTGHSRSPRWLLWFKAYRI